MTKGGQSGRRVLVILFGLFFLPIVIAWLLVFFLPELTPTHTRNRGELLRPAFQIPANSLTPENGHSAAKFSDVWTIAVITRGGCGDQCEARLDEISRVRLALSKDLEKVQIWLIFAGHAPARDADTITKRSAHVQRYAAPDGWPQTTGVSTGQFWAYVLDPRGFAILRYGHAESGQDILKDLQRLLRYSDPE